jgi:hypothetical protein
MLPAIMKGHQNCPIGELAPKFVFAQCQNYYIHPRRDFQILQARIEQER